MLFSNANNHIRGCSHDLAFNTISIKNYKQKSNNGYLIEWISYDTNLMYKTTFFTLTTSERLYGLFIFNISTHLS